MLMCKECGETVYVKEVICGKCSKIEDEAKALRRILEAWDVFLDDNEADALSKVTKVVEQEYITHLQIVGRGGKQDAKNKPNADHESNGGGVRDQASGVRPADEGNSARRRPRGRRGISGSK